MPMWDKIGIRSHSNIYTIEKNILYFIGNSYSCNEYAHRYMSVILILSKLLCIHKFNRGKLDRGKWGYKVTFTESLVVASTPGSFL